MVGDDGVVVVAPGSVVVVVVGAVFPFLGGFTAVREGAVAELTATDDVVAGSRDDVDPALVVVSAAIALTSVILQLVAVTERTFSPSSDTKSAWM